MEQSVEAIFEQDMQEDDFEEVMSSMSSNYGLAIDSMMSYDEEARLLKEIEEESSENI